MARWMKPCGVIGGDRQRVAWQDRLGSEDRVVTSVTIKDSAIAESGRDVKWAIGELKKLKKVI